MKNFDLQMGRCKICGEQVIRDMSAQNPVWLHTPIYGAAEPKHQPVVEEP